MNMEQFKKKCDINNNLGTDYNKISVKLSTRLCLFFYKNGIVSKTILYDILKFLNCIAIYSPI